MSVTDRASGPVIIAGAGPTGLTLATELRLGGAEVVLLERRPHRGVDGSRAAGMQPRTIEMLDQRGVAERFLAVGPQINLGNFAGILLDYSVLHSRFPHTFNILQAETEQILEKMDEELGVPVRWSSEVTAVHDTGDGVEVTVEGPNGTETVTGSYLIGCDGGRSVVRKLMGVGFPGTDATMMCLIGDVELDDPPQRPMFLQRRELGSITAVQFRPGWYRICTSEPKPADEATGPVTLEELRASTLRIAGTDFGMHDPTWLSRFSDAIRQADRYRVGRVFLAGDAAHIHLPAGGQGMNMGMQDAFNLGWKLAAVRRGDAPDSLLDTYHFERHAADAETLKVIRAQSVIVESGQRADDLFDMVKHLVGFAESNDYLATVQSGLGVRYAMPGEHPLLGRRVPDAEITSDTAATRIYELLNTAHTVLLDLSDSAEPANAVPEWTGRVDIIKAQSATETWNVPGVGAISTPAAVLIRPDGYVSWVSSGDHDLTGLRESLTTWCGPGI
jgi:2-polyprenyl-6-methoxyphenol hydroxylase-like FAD-dependent oxidoreductase